MLAIFDQSIAFVKWYETTLNYRMMMEGYSNFKEEASGSNPDYEVSSLPDGNLLGSQLSPMLWRWHVGFLSQIYIYIYI